MMNDIDKKLCSGELYRTDDNELLAEQAKRLELLYDYNATRPGEVEKRVRLLEVMFDAVGEGTYIEPPLHANWAGKHVRLGSNVYCNFGLTLVDDGCITVGSNTMIGPNVIIATAGHPVNPELRKRVYQFNLPVVIGENCWIGAGAIILPGVTVGAGSVIGAGSVVVKDIPSNVVAVGNPCRVLRSIGERDREFYHAGMRIPPDIADTIEK